jgi:hypothetical protein
MRAANKTRSTVVAGMIAEGRLLDGAALAVDRDPLDAVADAQVDKMGIAQRRMHSRRLKHRQAEREEVER